MRRFGRAMLHDHQIPEKFSDHAPGLHKWWKGYARTNGQVIEHISPYQQKIIAPLFRDPVAKATHKVVDNWHLIPGVGFLVAMEWYLDYRFEQLEREEWA